MNTDSSDSPKDPGFSRYYSIKKSSFDKINPLIDKKTIVLSSNENNELRKPIGVSAEIFKECDVKPFKFNFNNPSNDFSCDHRTNKLSPQEDLVFDESLVLNKKCNEACSISSNNPLFWEETEYSEMEGLNILSNLTVFKHLNEILIKIFCGDTLTSPMYNLSKNEEMLLNSILERKFATKADLHTLSTTGDKIVLLNSIIDQPPAKRPEEYYKFVITKVLKLMKNDFCTVKKICKKDLDEEFYRYYFDEEALSKGLNVSDYYYPLTISKCDVDRETSKISLNLEYYEKILASKKFRAVLPDYIDKLTYFYHREIIKKIEALLLKWDIEMQKENSNVKNLMTKYQDYLTENKRCKLPWTLAEVNSSIRKFQSFVEKITN